MFFFRISIPGSNSELTTGSIEAEKIIQEYGKTFWRFPLNLYLHESSEVYVEYNINNFALQGNFYLPAQSQTMNMVFHSCNGFSLSVTPEDFKGDLWRDVLRHHEAQHYHVMLGGGDQIYCDTVKLNCPPIAVWANEKSSKKKRTMQFTPKDKQITEEYILNHYIAWFGQGWWDGPHGKCLRPDFPKALAHIPSVNIFDDHDIIDGFGSYAEETMSSPIFSGIGQIAFKYYMLFQHQTNPAEDPKLEPSWILNPRPGPYMKQQARTIYARLGKEAAFLGLDCRTERTLEQIVYPDSYKIVFERLRAELGKDPNIRHLVVMLGVPIAYPRLVWLESILQSNLMSPLKFLSKKNIVLGGLVNDFDGAIEILDDLNDHWCAKTHKQERNQFVLQLQQLAQETSVRITLLGGDVHLGAMGRFYSSGEPGLYPETDHRLMLNVVCSAITNTPPSSNLADFLNTRNKTHHLHGDTDEDMVKLFKVDVDGTPRNNQTLLPRRNWCSIVQIQQRSTHYLNNHGKPNNVNVAATQPEGPIDTARFNSETDYPRYPDKKGALSIVLHFEKDQHRTSSETRPYEVIAPVLILKKNGTYRYQEQPYSGQAPAFPPRPLEQQGTLPYQEQQQPFQQQPLQQQPLQQQSQEGASAYDREYQQQLEMNSANAPAYPPRPQEEGIFSETGLQSRPQQQ